MIKIIPILYLLSTITLIGCDGDIQLKESGITRKIVDKNTTDNSSTPENCVDPDLSGIHTSITVVLCSGETARGLLNLTNLKSENLKENITVGGISGSLIPNPGICKSDGTSQCVVDGTHFRAAATANVVSSHIKTGVTIAGVAGTLVPSSGNCSSDGQGSCIVDGITYKAAKLVNFQASDIRAGTTIAGIPGSLANCPNGDSGCYAATGFKAVTSDNLIASNLKKDAVVGGVTGTYGPECSADGASNCIVDGTSYKSGATAQLINTNIKSGVTIGGIAGNVVPSPGNCTSDSQVGCVAAGGFKAVSVSAAVKEHIKTGVTIVGVKGWYTDTSSISIDASDIRVGKTIASITGTLKVDCRSAANLAKFDYEANGVVDVWDTIDDSNQFGAYPTAYPADWDDNYCGTSLWTDVSRTSGGVASNCATGDCIYQDVITKTMWTKNFAAANWNDAISACESSVAHPS